MPIWFDESEVTSILGTTRVYEYSVKFVFPGFGLINRLVEEFVKVNFEGEFEAIICLRSSIKIVPATRR